MNKLQAMPYLDAARDRTVAPLARHLPHYYPGMVSAWLTRLAEPCAVILDPIGASPRVILEAASRYRVIVNSNNPVTASILATLAGAPQISGFQSLLARLSALKRGEERLEEHLKSLYLTRCDNCRQVLQADAFLWRKGDSAPFARIYRCPACGDTGQRLITEEDLERLVGLQKSYPLHQARALERASLGTSDSQKLVEEVLNLYTPRAVYFIFTLLNKSEGIVLSPRQRDILEAVLLNVLDAGHSLNPWPETDEPPKSLSLPPEFIEKNLWLVMENAHREWCSVAPQVEVTQWPAMPAKAGISLHRGRIRDLGADLLKPQPQALINVIPRPLAAFWTLSAVWSGWIWGKENAASFMGILERRRFDWAWHAGALQAAFSATSKMVNEGTPFFGLIPEPVPGLINAIFEAASASDYELQGLAYYDESKPIQLEWELKPGRASAGKVNHQGIIRESLRGLLTDAGEPQRYIKLHTAVMADLAVSDALSTDVQQLRSDFPAELQKDIQNIATDSKFLRHMDFTSQEKESGFWWFAQSGDLPVPLADRVETAVLEYLRQQNTTSLADLVQHMNDQFPGFQTPNLEYVERCLSSYATQDLASRQWTLNEHDHADRRAQDVKTIIKLIKETGSKLGFALHGDNPLEWHEPGDAFTPVYRLYTAPTAQVGTFARWSSPESCQNVYLFPGSRAGLIKYKIDRNALLIERTAQNWHFLKFRTMRHLALRTDLSRELWTLLIDSDPISLEETTQLSMFNL
jgi:hypothetical protein